ncbi:MAG: hypothetical protein U0136_17560 [Bdellovibrionota bacterium]
MTKYFVPYSKDIPAAVDVKGHRLLLVSTDAEEILNELETLGGDTIRELIVKDGLEEQSSALTDLAASVNGGVVLTPPGVSPSSMIRNLEHELPWLH